MPQYEFIRGAGFKDKEKFRQSNIILTYSFTTK
jgi:hypothetical protein